MRISYFSSPRYAASIDQIGDYVKELKDELDDREIRNILSRIVGASLRLRTNIEYEKRCRGEPEEE